MDIYLRLVSAVLTLVLVDRFSSAGSVLTQTHTRLTDVLKYSMKLIAPVLQAEVPP